MCNVHLLKVSDSIFQFRVLEFECSQLRRVTLVRCIGRSTGSLLQGPDLKE